MKKKMMFVAAIATMGLGAFLTSCADETCTCTYVSDGIYITEEYETADFDVVSCGELENALDDANDVTGDYFDKISCK